MKPLNRILAASLFTFAALGSLQAADKDGVAMKNGKVMSVTDGQKTELTSDVTLSDGTKVTPGGNVTSADGKNWTLKDGEFIDMDGNFMTRLIKDGVIKKNGEVMKVTAGEKAALSAELVLADGTKVTPDSKVVSKEGKTWSLKDGDGILSDGRVLLDGSVLMKDGKPMVVADCMAKPLKDEISLNGIKVRPDGAVTKKDGGEATLNEGDVIQKDGTWLVGGRAE